VDVVGAIKQVADAIKEILSQSYAFHLIIFNSMFMEASKNCPVLLTLDNKPLNFSKFF
jgi:hypothetical protein